MVQSRPQPLTNRQDLIVETNAYPEPEIIPAIAERAMRLGAERAVLTIASDIEFNQAKPVACKSSHCLNDLEHLQSEMTGAQAHVINKTTKVFKACITQEMNKANSFVDSNLRALHPSRARGNKIDQSTACITAQNIGMNDSLNELSTRYDPARLKISNASSGFTVRHGSVRASRSYC